MGETRVDLLHLLEDLRDAYPGSLEETIVSEIVANALDSRAATIAFALDPAARTLAAVDDGTGMARRQLARYHDLAHTTKTRGKGIGFAGVGIKLGLLACDDVVTETRRVNTTRRVNPTRRGKTHVATSWRLASRNRAPWRWVTPPGLVGERGTAVRLTLTNPLSPLLDPGFIETALVRHFLPLFDPAFDELLSQWYPAGVRFVVNGHAISKEPPIGQRATLTVRVGRRRKPSAVGWLTRSAEPYPESERGVAVSTLGKVIKRGWDWLGVTPAAPDRVRGLIEVPALAECLTLNKADLIRTGTRGAVYLAHRRAIQQAVSAQLAEWGDARDEAELQRKKTRPVERDLEAVLVDMADEFPLLATLVERQRGGQRRLPMGRPEDAGPVLLGALGVSGEAETVHDESDTTTETPLAVSEPTAEPAAEPAEREPAEPSGAPLPGARGPRRPARYALTIRFEARADSEELGRLVESTVLVNEAHPAWQRAVASRAEGYHLALTVAMALAPLAVESSGVHAFVTAFLARWGEAAVEGRRGRGRR